MAQDIDTVSNQVTNSVLITIDMIKNNNLELVNLFSKKELCYYKMIDKFFNKCQSDKIIKMINIIDGNSNISLRILDWFVTKYSKRGIDINKDDELFDVHINYKAQLKSYKKRYFDPFRRKKRFNYIYNTNNTYSILQTTIGQLNFFRWAINYDIIIYVDTHLTQIMKAMNVSNKEILTKKKIKLTKNTMKKHKPVRDVSQSDSDISDNSVGDSNNELYSDEDSVGDSAGDSDGDSDDDNSIDKKSVYSNERTPSKASNNKKNIIKNNSEIDLVLSFD
jgi:hypothetical protein